jgi:hypothetical protein
VNVFVVLVRGIRGVGGTVGRVSIGGRGSVVFFVVSGGGGGGGREIGALRHGSKPPFQACNLSNL